MRTSALIQQIGFNTSSMPVLRKWTLRDFTKYVFTRGPKLGRLAKLARSLTSRLGVLEGGCD